MEAAAIVPATTVDSLDISPETALPSLVAIPQAEVATIAVKLVTSAEVRLEDIIYACSC